MPLTNRLGLNTQGQDVILQCPNTARAGVGVSGNWVGTLSLKVSYDGTNFFPATFTPFPSGAGVNTTTANGNWFIDLQGAVAVQVVATLLTSGTALVSIAAAVDGAWQDAFLAPSSLSLSQNVTGGALNSQTAAGQSNRAWRCRSASVSFNGAPANPVEFQILDGASNVLWDGYVPVDINTSAAGGVFNVPLPPPDPAVPGSGGVVGTVGNGMTLKLFAPGGSVVSTVNGELHAA